MGHFDLLPAGRRCSPPVSARLGMCDARGQDQPIGPQQEFADLATKSESIVGPVTVWVILNQAPVHAHSSW